MAYLLVLAGGQPGGATLLIGSYGFCAFGKIERRDYGAQRQQEPLRENFGPAKR